MQSRARPCRRRRSQSLARPRKPTSWTAKPPARLTRFEIEVASKDDRHHIIKNDDVVAIAPIQPGEAGYLAVLDMAGPLRWATLEHSRIRARLGQTPISTLHAVSDREMSNACNDAFTDLIRKSADRLFALTFHLLRKRTLREDEL